MLDWCNYKCEYCCVGIPNRKPTANSFMSDALVAKTLQTLEQLPGRWRIHFSGGEPTLHPLFIDACAHLVSKGHSVSVLTNFSARMKTFKDGSASVRSLSTGMHAKLNAPQNKLTVNK